MSCLPCTNTDVSIIMSAVIILSSLSNIWSLSHSQTLFSFLLSIYYCYCACTIFIWILLRDAIYAHTLPLTHKILAYLTCVRMHKCIIRSQTIVELSKQTSEITEKINVSRNIRIFSPFYLPLSLRVNCVVYIFLFC